MNVNSVPLRCTMSLRVRDRGFSLIEVLVSVVLLGTAGIAVLAAMAATATGAAVQRQVSDAQVALAAAGDAVTSVDVDDDNFEPCISDLTMYDDVINAAVGAPSVPVSVVSVMFWDGDSWEATCIDDAADRLQKVTLQSSGNDRTYELAVVKRRADAPTVNTVAIDPAAPGAGSSGGMVAPTPHPGL